ncbi:DUF2508 family protein [Propionispora vibrioides]|uniref:DUF2508 family protein n=1 Tax=Propionispora vibrioides TaxID=112903 RepID=A0A1H8Y4Z6_9FIRM|nr:DUF2508 family protein [Propionispora vibrioides]SEP47063.1 Protein of unknown function [Propionispora vibrioides]
MMAWRTLLTGWLMEEQRTATVPNLWELIEQAKCDWLYAHSYYNNVSEPDLLEYAIYMIKASEKKYTYLLKQARFEGLKEEIHINRANKYMTGC